MAYNNIFIGDDSESDDIISDKLVIWGECESREELHVENIIIRKDLTAKEIHTEKLTIGGKISHKTIIKANE